jgi:hypothetical protein
LGAAGVVDVPVASGVDGGGVVVVVGAGAVLALAVEDVAGIDVLCVEADDDVGVRLEVGEVEAEVERDTELSSEEAVVAVGTAVVLDTRVGMGLTQNGNCVSAPMHVCPFAQQMEPHLKSPTAQTRVHPEVPASEGQQKKAPLMMEHVSLAPPA